MSLLFDLPAVAPVAKPTEAKALPSWFRRWDANKTQTANVRAGLHPNGAPLREIGKTCGDCAWNAFGCEKRRNREGYPATTQPYWPACDEWDPSWSHPITLIHILAGRGADVSGFSDIPSRTKRIHEHMTPWTREATDIWYRCLILSRVLGPFTGPVCEALAVLGDQIGERHGREDLAIMLLRDADPSPLAVYVVKHSHPLNWRISFLDRVHMAIESRKAP